MKKDAKFLYFYHGEASLIRYDERGNKDIVDYFKPGSIFGETLYNVYLNSELSVVATKKVSLLTIMYEDLTTKCDSHCKFHEELISLLLDLLFENTTHLNSRIEVMSKRTIREKLNIYFKTLSIESFSNRVTIPFSLTDLADFLSVNRSAMMRELKALEDDGIIKKISKNTYKLMYR